MTAIAVHILTVDAAGEALAESCADAGYTVSGPTATDVDGVARAIAAAPGADVVVIVSDTAGVVDGVGGEARYPGFGETVRAVVRQRDPAAAILLRVFAGQVGDRTVFTVPTDATVVEGALLPALAALQGGHRSAPVASDAKPAGPAVPVGAVGLAAVEPAHDSAPPPESEELPDRGWKRAIHDLSATVTLGRREELPEPIEKLAPVVNVLHTAGEFGTMKLPSGRRYGLYGWPDLRRPGAKVLAVSWGDPLAEIIALHRHPVETGTTIVGNQGLYASADVDVARFCEDKVGRAPRDVSGQVFAFTHEAVWILRGRRVIKWDGSREVEDGNPKQVLSSLTLRWSAR